jgi:diguanylate cyclase (GGDEF)-like protein
VLEHAKRKDEFTEVIVITGYASLDSATLAINQGVYSYLLKPLQIAEFIIQVEKAIASRLFHLRSIRLMMQSDDFAPDVRMHVQDITSLYYFIRKLMLSLEISEIMRITLDEVNRRMGSPLAVISVTMGGNAGESFVMPSQGEVTEEQVAPLLSRLRTGEPASDGVPGHRSDAEPVPLIYKGREGAAPSLEGLVPLSVPMMVTDRVIGVLTVFVDGASPPPPEQNQYLYVFSSIVSSVIDHGYIALQARRQAKTDSLTGIANHRHFHETLDREISRANRRRSSFTLVLLDIDNFKKVNDTWGHQVGDAVLVDMTREIMTMIRAGDVLARYGGEEFGLILPDTDLAGAEILADRILRRIATHPFSFNQQEIRYTVSIGLAVYRGEFAVEKDRLIAAADRALYDSKENGRNRLSIGTIVV